MSIDPTRDETMEALLHIATSSLDQETSSGTSVDSDQIAEAIKGLTAAVLYLAGIVSEQRDGA